MYAFAWSFSSFTEKILWSSDQKYRMTNKIISAIFTVEGTEVCLFKAVLSSESFRG